MKNFMKKLPVMITFVALAVVWLVVYIGLQVRPIAYGNAYKHTETKDKVTTETYYTLNTDNTASIRTIETDFSSSYESEYTVWYIKEGKYVVIGYIAEETKTDRMQFKTFEEFEKFVEDNKILDKDAIEENYKKSGGYMFTITSTAFTAQICQYGYDYELDDYKQSVRNTKNYGTIAFSVVGGIVVLALIAGAVVSVLFYIKDRKAPAAPVEEAPAETPAE